ncbi:uncharacterized protein LOC116156068 [Camelus dromedarius]|uniref:uncharacterized protein LOC116156068 n=1 Tax=Camelus dromedarius TaxID=9838 RepID=UPI00311A1F09
MPKAICCPRVHVPSRVPGAALQPSGDNHAHELLREHNLEIPGDHTPPRELVNLRKQTFSSSGRQGAAGSRSERRAVPPLSSSSEAAAAAAADTRSLREAQRGPSGGREVLGGGGGRGPELVAVGPRSSNLMGEGSSGVMWSLWMGTLNEIGEFCELVGLRERQSMGPELPGSLSSDPLGEICLLSSLPGTWSLALTILTFLWRRLLLRLMAPDSEGDLLSPPRIRLLVCVLKLLHMFILLAPLV